MSGGYMSRLFPKSNSSLLLHTGTALKSTVHRLRDDKYFLVDSGIASPKLCLRDALTSVPSGTSFHNKVGFMGKPGPETEVNRSFLERYFIDIVAGDATAKAIATARVFDLIGSVDGTSSGSSNEPLIVLPRKYRQKQALMELNKLWRQNKKVNGFILEKVRGGYLVAIGGYIAFLRFRPLINQKILSSSSFTISSIGFVGKRPDILVF
nr:ribosomal protein S1 [Sedum plumbizincicola]